ncbi:MAG: PilN domain-containing protein [Candidatus Eisenbacteria sp.]|nr:PilN domain-containing protein [Candidatus Eisenbacteria bacterium]
MISVNLLPQEERVVERDLAARPRARVLLPILMGVALLIPPAVLHWRQESRIQSLTRAIEIAQQEQLGLQPRLVLIDDLKAKTADLEQRLDLVRSLNRERTFPVRLMDELCAQMPPHVWLTQMKQNGAGLYLEGMTFSNLVIADLMSRLEETDVYKDVDLAIAERKNVGEDRVVHFTLSANIVRNP